MFINGKFFINFKSNVTICYDMYDMWLIAIGDIEIYEIRYIEQYYLKFLKKFRDMFFVITWNIIYYLCN